MTALVCFDRRAQELLGKSGDQDERIADVGVSGKQFPLPLYRECRQKMSNGVGTKTFTLGGFAVTQLTVCTLCIRQDRNFYFS